MIIQLFIPTVEVTVIVVAVPEAIILLINACAPDPPRINAFVLSAESSMTERFIPKLAVLDEVIAKGRLLCLTANTPAETVLALKEEPEFVNFVKSMFIVPEAECVNKPIPVVPKSPVQLFRFIPEDPLEDENVMPVLLVQFR